MPPRSLPLIAALCLLAVVHSLPANLYVPYGTGTTLAPVRTEDIAMVSERVLLEENPPANNFRASAVYTMRNESDRTIATHVAFPFRETRHDALRDRNFRVTVADARGVETQPSFEVIRPNELEAAPYDFGAACVWPVTWAPHETKVITVEYTVGSIGMPYLFVEGWKLSYIVNTGAFWKGPIGSAEFTFRFHSLGLVGSLPKPGRDPDTVYPPYSYPDNVEIVSPTEVRWRFENWMPGEDIWIGSMRWVGLNQNPSLLDIRYDYRDYQAHKVIYDDAVLENFATQVLAIHREHFPLQTQRFHRELKAFQAKRLYYAILARHGDPLLIKKERKGESRPAEAVGDAKWGYYHSVWREHFERASDYHGDWYRPGTGRAHRGTVRRRDLTAIEQQNLNFLKTYFAP